MALKLNVPALVAIREKGGDSQETLAARAGLSAEAIRLIERGDTAQPRPKTIRALADALRVPVAAITLPEGDAERVAS